MAMLEVRNLGKCFAATEVLTDISFSLEKGESLAVIGSSGSGKTTMLRCLNFLETPDKGAIWVNGQCVFDAAAHKTLSSGEIRRRRLHFGLVFQSFNLFPQYTAFQNVVLAGELLAKERTDFRSNKRAILEEIHQRGRELLDSVGLSAKLDSYPHQLSGGQQQRVAIARALVNNPRVILADEPTGNLDSTTGREIVEVLKALAEQGGKVVVVVTHDGMVASQAHRLLQMMDGRIIDDSKLEVGSVVFSHPKA